MLRRIDYLCTSFFKTNHLTLKNFEYQDILRQIEEARNIVIVSHHNPDGDAIGSVLAMYHFLQPMGKQVNMVVPNDFPAFLKWLQGSDLILLYDRQKKEVKRALKEADMVFCLDFNALHRAGDMENSLRKSGAPLFLIDHHPEPEVNDFKYWLSITRISSTAELVHRFIRGLGYAGALDKPLAEALFAGIMTDTGSFSYACNYPETFLTIAELMQAGVDAERVHRLVYDTYSENRLRLLGYAISQKMMVMHELKTAFITLSLEELEQYDYQVGDTEGVVNYALSINGIVIAVLLTERKDRIRLSFRSKGDFAVNRIAREHFQGGGHVNAAGGDSFHNMDVTINTLKQVLQQYKAEIDRSTY